MPGIDDAIAAAGNLLAQQWKSAKPMQVGNDLHPEPAAIAFQLKLLSDRVAELERLVKGSQHVINSRR